MIIINNCSTVAKAKFIIIQTKSGFVVNNSKAPKAAPPSHRFIICVCNQSSWKSISIHLIMQTPLCFWTYQLARKLVSKHYPSDMSRKCIQNYVSFFSKSHTIVGRMIIELRADVVPKTAENFRRLCDGSAGIGSYSKRQLTYEGTHFYKVQRTFAVQGGDVANNSGHSGESIYGRYFDDENFTLSVGLSILLVRN